MKATLFASGLPLTLPLAVLMGMILVSWQAIGQATPGTASIKTTPTALHPWEFTLNMDSYSGPQQTSYVNPVLAADHNWLHLEARYNDENLRTASLWVGYNFGRGDFSSGDKWEVEITPMLGGVFGRTNGLAPGCEILLSYQKKVEASINNEYVFDAASKLRNFYYAWPQLTYSPAEWFHVGGVAQHTKTFNTAVSIQRGFLVGFSHRGWELTTYVFDPASTRTIVVLELGVNF